MRPIRVTVGALASASATKIALSQTVGSAAALALNGAAGSFSANNICASQSPGGAVNMTINGSSAANGIASFAPGKYVYVTSAGNDSGITFKISGLDRNGAFISQTLTGANTSIVATSIPFWSVTGVATSGASASTVTVGSFTTATLDLARRVIITSGGNDTGITFTITGADGAGNSQSEVITGASGSAASSVLDYLTITSILASAASASTVTVGTNGVAGSPWVRLDEWANASTAIQCSVSGTVNYTLQTTLDDVNLTVGSVAESAVNWFQSSDGNLVNQTVSAQGSFGATPLYARVLLNSGSGSVTATFSQASVAPY